MTLLRALLVATLALWIGLAGAQALAPIPSLNAHVTDSAGMLEPQQRAALESVLRDYQARTGSQIGVLLVNSTAPEVIEQYSIRVADAWKLGRKGVDDGAILIVAKDNPKALRRLRIEAGRGVQGSLTDAQSKRILQDVIAPHFRQNDYYGGLVAGVAAMTNLLDREHFPAPAAGQAARTAESDSFSWFPFLFFGFLIFAALLRSRGGRRQRFSDHGWGGATGVILGNALGHRIGSGGLGGGFGGGGFGGGGFSGGGGGFSGGGGGFDGGGASGDW